MSLFRKFLNLGCDNPLALSMGHPLKDRVKRLHHKTLRGGGLVTALLICGGLAVTGLSQEPSLLKQAGPLSAEFWSYVPNVKFPEKVISVEVTSNQMIVNAHADNEDMEVSMVEPQAGDIGDKYVGLLSSCFKHALGYKHALDHKLPLTFFVEEKLLERDTDKQLYMVWCQPGDVEARNMIASSEMFSEYLMDLSGEADGSSKPDLFGHVVGVHLGEAIMRQAKREKLENAGK